ncbi:MAG TPA: DUF192 domain-containing protein [Ignavibacteria bacterium]|nr:DUF192 domain-containing protein [Ignavibacteria bacterium]
MSKSKQTNKVNKQNSNKNNSNMPKYIFIGVLVLVAAYLIYIFFIKKEEVMTPPHQPTIQQYQPPPITDTIFTKEGEVTFMKKGGKKILHKFNVEVSDEDKERAQGLMYRAQMGTDEAMIFLFPRSEPQSFWMKNTKIPLDIIYINEKNEVVKIYKMTKPFSLDSLPSEKNAMYVVEINGGLSDKFGIAEGDIIEFRKN